VAGAEEPVGEDGALEPGEDPPEPEEDPPDPEEDLPEPEEDPPEPEAELPAVEPVAPAEGAGDRLAVAERVAAVARVARADAAAALARARLARRRARRSRVAGLGRSAPGKLARDRSGAPVGGGLTADSSPRGPGSAVPSSGPDTARPRAAAPQAASSDAAASPPRREGRGGSGRPVLRAAGPIPGSTARLRWVRLEPLC
jgi:hypothetical protein